MLAFFVLIIYETALVIPMGVKGFEWVFHVSVIIGFKGHIIFCKSKNLPAYMFLYFIYKTIIAISLYAKA